MTNQPKPDAAPRLILTPGQFKEGWNEFRPDEIPNLIKHQFRNPVKLRDGNWEVDALPRQVADAAPAQGRADDAQIFVVDRAVEAMTDEQLANLIHGATHELYRRVTGEVKR